MDIRDTVECKISDVPLTRSRFLKLASLGPPMAAMGLPHRADAAERTAAEMANLALVTDFCNSFAGRDMRKIAAFLADDCAYRIIETAPPARGKDAIERIRSYVDRSARIELKILESWVKGPVVVNERIDSFEPAPPNSPYHLTGVFFVRGGKIAEWTDYLIRP
jgi:limonene-1,2-epoxide hydrolase